MQVLLVFVGTQAFIVVRCYRAFQSHGFPVANGCGRCCWDWTRHLLGKVAKSSDCEKFRCSEVRCWCLREEGPTWRSSCVLFESRGGSSRQSCFGCKSVGSSGLSWNSITRCKQGWAVLWRASSRTDWPYSQPKDISGLTQCGKRGWMQWTWCCGGRIRNEVMHSKGQIHRCWLRGVPQ